MSDDYVARVEAERAKRVARLMAPDGWLALVARHWLDDGDNQLPVGVVTLREGVVTLRVADGVEARLNGEVVELVREWTGDEAPRPMLIEALGQKWDLVRRGDRVSVRVKDEAAPARRGFAGLEYFPVDARWVVQARFEPCSGRFVELTSSSGMPLRVRAPGRALFQLDGKDCVLEPVMDGGRLQFIFGDGTNRVETYRAGRFLYAAMTREDQLVLDFNLAINPPCAFNDLAVCPLATAHNRLPVRIEAGEKRYSGAHAVDH